MVTNDGQQMTIMGSFSKPTTSIADFNDGTPWFTQSSSRVTQITRGPLNR